VERVNDEGGKTFVQEKSENVVAVMASSLKSYFYFAQIRCYRLERLEEQVEADLVIGDGENIRQDLSIRVYDVAIMFVFGNINADIGHGVSLLDIVLMLLGPQASCHS
jgi:hypothetical protein